MAFPERSVPPSRADLFETMISRRLSGEPIAYITGTKEFWSLSLKVNPSVLIPRPETELLVEAVLERVAGSASNGLLDLGTGSGAIALAIKSERPDLFITATDASTAALETARGNANHLGISGIEFLAGDWFAPVTGRRFGCVVSNPPYVEEFDTCLDDSDIRFEPRAALAAGADGLSEIRKIATGVGRYLTAGGWVLLEHGYDQDVAVRSLLSGVGFRESETLADLNGLPRVTLARVA